MPVFQGIFLPPGSSWRSADASSLPGSASSALLRRAAEDYPGCLPRHNIPILIRGYSPFLPRLLDACRQMHPPRRPDQRLRPHRCIRNRRAVQAHLTAPGAGAHRPQGVGPFAVAVYRSAQETQFRGRARGTCQPKAVRRIPEDPDSCAENFTQRIGVSLASTIASTSKAGDRYRRAILSRSMIPRHTGQAQRSGHLHRALRR
jgi:hypothetical protein